MFLHPDRVFPDTRMGIALEINTILSYDFKECTSEICLDCSSLALLLDIISKINSIMNVFKCELDYKNNSSSILVIILLE